MTPFFTVTPAAPKICGVTKSENALHAIEAGAGALGFNFYAPSPRAISADDDLGWIRNLKKSFPLVALVAVVVNPDYLLLKRLRDAGCFDAIQFHGDETPEFCQREGAAFDDWIKALRVRMPNDLMRAMSYDTSFLLLDAAVPGSYGGSGQQLDWSLAKKFIHEHPEKRVILAGGLTPENVSQAVTAVQPHAVDVASGVESSPGNQAPEKIRRFLAEASLR